MPSNFVKPILLVVFALFQTIAVFGQEESNDTRTGHTDVITAAAFSPDSKLLATAGDDQTIIVWDMIEVKEVMKIVWDKTDIKAVAYSPDGKIIAGSGDGGVKFWDAKTGKEIGMLKNEFEMVDSIAFSPDGKLVAAGSSESVSIWNVASRQKIRALEKTKSPVAFNPQGNLLATASGDDLIKIWNVKTGVKIRTIEGAGEARTLGFNSPGNVLASVSQDSILERKVRLWRTLNGTAMKTPNEIKTSGLLSFSPDGKSILVGSETPGDILILNSLTGKEKDSFSGNFDFTTKGAFSPDGKLLLILTDLSKEASIFNFQTKEEFAVLEGYSINVASLVFSSDDKTLLAGYSDRNLIHWNYLTGKLEKIVTPEKIEYSDDEFNSISAFGSTMVISEDGKIFAAGGVLGLGIFDVSNGDLLLTGMLPDTNPVFSRDGHMVAAFVGKTVALFTAPDIEEYYRVPLQISEDITRISLAFSPDGKMLAIGTKTEITFWDIDARKEIKAIRTNFQSLPDLQFSSDNKFLVVADAYANIVKVFDLANDSIVHTLDGQGRRIAISEDGKILAGAGWENIFLTELSTRKTLGTIKTESFNSINKMRFNHGGSVLAVGDSHGITIYKTTTGEQLRSMQ